MRLQKFALNSRVLAVILKNKKHVEVCILSCSVCVQPKKQNFYHLDQQQKKTQSLDETSNKKPLEQKSLDETSNKKPLEQKSLLASQ